MHQYILTNAFKIRIDLLICISQNCITVFIKIIISYCICFLIFLFAVLKTVQLNNDFFFGYIKINDIMIKYFLFMNRDR